MTGTDRHPYHSLEPVAKHVRFEDGQMLIDLVNGGGLRVPLEWFPALAGQPLDVLKQYELVADNTVIHWEAVDEWLSVPSLLGHPD